MSGSGFVAGASRALVFAGYPFSLVAVAIVWIAAARVVAGSRWRPRRLPTGLCATVGFPGVIDQADLDARPVNGLAGVGVLLALALTIWALVDGGRGDSAPFRRDGLDPDGCGRSGRLVAAPWIWAEFGFYISNAPLLGSIFLAEQIRPSLGGEPSLHAVHLGHHHGMDGTLLALSAIVLSRVPGRMPRKGEAIALALYVALMLAYGLANALQDGWNEQLVKRGTVGSKLPSVIRPDLSPAWRGFSWVPPPSTSRSSA